MLHRYAPPQWRGAGSSPYGEPAASDARGPAAAMYWIHSTLDTGYQRPTLQQSSTMT